MTSVALLLMGFITAITCLIIIGCSLHVIGNTNNNWIHHACACCATIFVVFQYLVVNQVRAEDPPSGGSFVPYLSIFVLRCFFMVMDKTVSRVLESVLWCLWIVFWIIYLWIGIEIKWMTVSVIVHSILLTACSTRKTAVWVTWLLTMPLWIPLSPIIFSVMWCCMGKARAREEVLIIFDYLYEGRPFVRRPSREGFEDIPLDDDD